MQSHVKNIFENLILQPAVVTDPQNELLYINNSLKIEFGLESEEKAEKAVKEILEDSLFIEHFDKVKASSEQSEFSWSRKNTSDESSYKIKISRLNIESEDYIITLFERSDQGSNNNKYKFSINFLDVQTYVKNNSLEEILNKVKSSFPFTFIGKQKFQRDIDKIPNKFWIKNVDQSIIIANKEFASAFGMKLSQIQSASAKKLYKELDLIALQSAERFLLKSFKPVIIDISSSEDINKQEVLIELPLIDIDHNIVAIVGFSDNAGLEHSIPVTLGNEVFSKLLKHVNRPFLLIDKELKIVNYNDQFSELFLQGSNNNIGKLISDLLKGELLHKINSFVQSARDYVDDYIEQNKNGYEKIQMSLSKISGDGNDLGYYISFDTKISNNKNDLKGKMYDIIMQTSPEPLFIYDIENLKFIEVNKAALTLYGYSREEFLDMDLTDLYAPEDIQTLIESSPDKSTSSDFTGPWRHRHKNGSTILVEISKSTLEHQDKKAHFNIVRVVTDILEEKKLLQSFKSVYDNSNDPVINTDQDGFISSANKAALKFLRSTVDELKNKPFLSLVSDDDRVKVNSKIFHANLTIPVTLDIKIKLTGGGLADATIHATPVLNYNNEVASFTIVLTLKSKAIDRSSHESEPENKADKLDKTFLANLFHELLTPVNVIVGFTRELSDSIKNPNEEQKESVDIINDNQKLLLQIMDNAVEYSSIEQNEVELNIENLTFVEILDDIEDNVKKFAKFNNVDFSYGKISSSLKFETDRAKLISLLTMWIKFAIQATDRKKIFLSAYSAGNDFAFISVNDERSAMSKELFENLQFIFTEDESLVKQKHGISRFTVRLARKLIDVLGGNKEVVYKGGKAVEFGFKFPMKFTPAKFFGPGEVQEIQEVVARPQTKVRKEVKEVIPQLVENSTTVEEVVVQEPVRQANTHTAQQIPPKVDTTSQSTTINVTVQTPQAGEGTKQPAATTEPVHTKEPETSMAIDLKDMTCLYVEDQVDSQILFKVQMKGLRSIEYATSFEKALPIIESKHFDFIVMDINLQGEYNGLDALRAIQKMPGHENIPIIAVTAYVLPGDKEKFIAAGFSDFITKPILKDKLDDILKKMFA